MRHLVFVALIAAACSQPAAPQLPPPTLDHIAPLFENTFQRMGLVLTRAGLHDTDQSYRRSAQGDHLALYVEPVEVWSPRRYAEMVMPSLRPLVPEVFTQWPGLASFDICIEPPQALDPAPEPEPATQVFLTRDASDALDWDTATLTELRGLAESSEDVRLRISERVAAALS